MLEELSQLDLGASALHPHLLHPRTGAPLRAVGHRRDGTPIWPILGAADDDDDSDDSDDDDDKGNGKKDDDDDSDDDSDDDDDKKLGPKGERALAAEKEKRRKARAAQQKAEKDLADARAEIERLKGGKDDNDADDRKDATATEAKEAEARANTKIVRAEIKALAADTFIDVSDAVRELDASKYEVDEDGELVDVDDLKDDLAEVLKNKPHLAKKSRRFQGDGDGGNRGNGKKPDPGPGRDRMRSAYAASSKK